MAGQTDQLVKPGSGRGLLDVYGDRFLLKLLVRKEIKVRYRGSVLGLLWSYVKPLVQFLIYFVALGIFLNLQRGTPNYAIYLFAGIVLVNFFTESLSNATRSIVDNRDLIRKIYLPRELFPVSTVWVSAAHFLPQLLVLIGACLVVGWTPSILQLGAVVLIFGMVAVLATGLGLMFGAVNVYFRDSENIVDMIVMVVTWASPVLYVWSMVERVMGPWFWVYQLNPMTVAVEVFHWAFWEPTLKADQMVADTMPPDLLTVWLPVAMLVTLTVLFLGQLTFRRLAIHFAQEL
ncbi:ABC-2 type transport system permease protein [Pseudarthrobacter oxydans]|uniref:Transport permease protein n=1 Tax=Pseudarthrobacter oxydans TaxID=1671 RepID=A0AAW8N418_PSEOX|nr:ABC transporter permease [Pseudarthrobacter oxydans]MDR6792390.1 ABC-2 type transport system permease protein [Pseudarthrobacter oxydans]MDR7162121.1 ABC-2 type transport system permease protein [Pseudarthrobacter oxydans]